MPPPRTFNFTASYGHRKPTTSANAWSTHSGTVYAVDEALAGKEVFLALQKRHPGELIELRDMKLRDPYKR